MLHFGSRSRAIAVLIILLMSALPLAPIASAVDVGDPELLQAQDISVNYDSVSETTTITWRNIGDEGGVVELFDKLWDSSYHVYRHTEVITSTNVASLEAIAGPIVACDKAVIGGNPGHCRGEGGSVQHPGHSLTVEIQPGVDDIFYYAITTTLPDDTVTTLFDDGASNYSTGVSEVTSPIRSPYNIQASYDPNSQETTINWINYNDLNPILPTDGDDAYTTNLWRTDVPVSRVNAGGLLGAISPVAVLESGNSSYTYEIPQDTSRESYYSVTYNLPNFTTPGQFPIVSSPCLAF